MISQFISRLIHAIAFASLACGGPLLSSCDNNSSNPKISQSSGSADKRAEENQKAIAKQQETLEQIVKLLASNSEQLRQLESTSSTTGQNLVQSNEKIVKLLESTNKQTENNKNTRVIANGEQLASLIPEDAISYNTFCIQTTEVFKSGNAYEGHIWYSNDGTYARKEDTDVKNDSDLKRMATYGYADSPKNKCLLCNLGVFVFSKDGAVYFDPFDKIDRIIFLRDADKTGEITDFTKNGVIHKKEDKIPEVKIILKPNYSTF